jgi:hypothetical protein
MSEVKEIFSQLIEMNKTTFLSFFIPAFQHTQLAISQQVG